MSSGSHPDHLLHYTIQRELGAGGMGMVYLAHDSKLDRPVALKFLHARLQDVAIARERLRREARAASRLVHPNILTIHAVENTEDGDFIVMEYLPGRSLRDVLTDDEPGLDAVLDLLIPVARALGAAHEQGVVHRDIKPENVLVGEKGIVKVMDFGLSHVEDASQLTKSGSTLGTLSYMSPEQAQGKKVDRRTDVFAFGVTLYEMITGRRPFQHDPEHPAAVVQAILHAAPEPMARYKAGVPDELQRVVDRLLEKDRELRYQTMEDVASDLERVRRVVGGVNTPPQSSTVHATIGREVAASSSDAGLTRHDTDGDGHGGPVASSSPTTGGALSDEHDVRMRFSTLGALALLLVAASGTWFAWKIVPRLEGAPTDRPTVAPTPVEEADAGAGDDATPAPPPVADDGVLRGRLAHQRQISIAGGEAAEPTLSPDGTQVAFVMKDDEGVPQVWLKGVAEGDPLRLTSGERPCHAPAWSPRGDLIAFSRRLPGDPSNPWFEFYELWIVAPPTGTPRRIAASGHHAAWFADGSRLIYEALDGIHVNSAEGDDDRLLEFIPRPPMPLWVRFPVVSPDDARVAWFQPALGPAGDLWIAALDGSDEPRRLTHEGDMAYGHTWSGDGRWLIQSSGRGGSVTLWQVSTEDGRVEPLTTGTGADTRPTASADGRRVVYENARQTSVLKVYDPASGNVRELFQSRGGLGASTWSPDGKQLTFFAGESRGLHISVVGADGKGLRKVTRGEGTIDLFPEWAGPDGRWIYHFRRVGDAMDWGRTPVAGGPMEILREGWSPHRQVFPHLDPAGTRVAYMLVESMKSMPQLIVEDIESGEARAIAGGLYSPRFSSDGTRVTGQAFDGGIYVVDVETGKSRGIARGFAPDWGPGDERLYYLRGDPSRYVLHSVRPDGADDREETVLGPLNPLSLLVDVGPSGEVTWVHHEPGRSELWLMEFK